MKTVTNNFKEELTKFGREIDFKFSLHTNDKIITEDGKFLMTQANQHLVVEQFDDTEVDEIITAEDIINVNIITCGNILSTMMKELDFEIKKDLRIGDVIDCEFGLKVNGDYEYINYGSYMVYSKEYNEDTQTYSYVAYDRMMLTMQEANAEFLDSLEEKTIANDISTICSTVGLTFNATQEELTNYPNLSKEINDGTFTDLQITYRDILDMMCQALGLSMIVEDKQLVLKPLDRTIKDTFDETYLKDTNAIFSKKYGPINSVVLSRSEDNDNIYVRDEESIENNGLCEFKIKDNPILLYNDREDYIDEIFDQLNGLEYFPSDFSSTGITYLDWLDFYNVTIGNKVYKCLMLNDEIKIEQGLEESIYSEEPEETETPYKTSSKTDKEVSFIVDKQKGNIRAKVSKGQVINEINLDESGASINADKISLAGKTIEMTSDNIAINSTNFQVDKNGNIIANNGTLNNVNVNGGNIIMQSTGGNPNLSCIRGDSELDINATRVWCGNWDWELPVTKYNIYNFEYANQNVNSSGNPNQSHLFIGKYDIVNNNRQNVTGFDMSIDNSDDNELYYYYKGDYLLNFDNGNCIIRDTNGDYINLYNGVHLSSTPIIDSDKRLKQEIKTIDVSWLDKLKIKEYEYKNNPDKKQIGLIAQDYIDEEYSKYFLNKDEKGYYGIAYGNITNALIQYCQELKKEVNSLKEEIKELKESDK